MKTRALCSSETSLRGGRPTGYGWDEVCYAETHGENGARGIVQRSRNRRVFDRRKWGFFIFERDFITFRNWLKIIIYHCLIFPY